MDSLLAPVAMVGSWLTDAALFGLIAGSVGAIFLGGRNTRVAKPRQNASIPCSHNAAKVIAEDMLEDFELSIYPVLRNSDTQRRIMECAKYLRDTREKLAEEFGGKAFGQGRIEHGHEREFRQGWKTACQVAEANYGDIIMCKALALIGYRREFFG